MRLREFIAVVSPVAAGPLALRRQQLTPVIAFLNALSADGYAPMVAAIGQGRKEAGYVGGRRDCNFADRQ
jgi:hypothetical protein